MSERFAVNVEHWQNFQFLIDFNQDGVTDLLTDEAPPLGSGKGPNPARVLAAAIGNCLASSLLFCLKKAHIEPHGIRATVEGEMMRNENGKMRIKEFRVRVEPMLTDEDTARLSRCGDLFEDYCIVTESVRNGIDVVVELAPVSAKPVTL